MYEGDPITVSKGEGVWVPVVVGPSPLKSAASGTLACAFPCRDSPVEAVPGIWDQGEAQGILCVLVGTSSTRRSNLGPRWRKFTLPQCRHACAKLVAAWARMPGSPIGIRRLAGNAARAKAAAIPAVGCVRRGQRNAVSSATKVATVASPSDRFAGTSDMDRRQAFWRERARRTRRAEPLA